MSRRGDRGSGYRLRWLALVLVLGVVAASCGDDSDGDDGGAETGGDATTTTVVDDAGGEDASSTSAPPETSAEPEPLPASFRGVTEDTIRVGVAVPDFDALQAAGISNYQGDADVAFQAFFDAINADGGVFGRQIDPVYVSFDFVQPETQDRACAELAEDNEVFIVLYGLLGASNLCLTEIHDTMVMTRSFQTTDLREASGDTLWLQLNAADDARTRIMGDVFASSGRLDGRTIGILASSGENNGLDGQVLQETLAGYGYDSLLLVTEASGGDPIARDSEFTVLAERFKAEGVDFLFELRGGGDAVGVFANAGFTPQYAFKALGAAVDGAADRTLLDGALSVSEINEQAMIDDPQFQSNCLDVVRDANPELADEMAFVPSGDEQAAGQPNWVNPVMIACDQTMLLDAIGEIAGADLSNDSFRAALDVLGPVDLNGYGRATFDSESKWDGLDEFFVQQYDAGADAIDVVGDAVVVDR